MTPRERAIAALELRTPDDIVPTFEILFDLTEELLGRVLSLKPDNAHGHRQLALTYLFSNKKPADALHHAELAVKLAPTAVNYDVLGWAAYKNGNFTQALTSLKHAMKLDPKNTGYKARYKKIFNVAQK